MATKEFIDVRTDNPKVPADTDVLCGQEPAGGAGSQIGFTKAELLQAIQAEVDLNTAKVSADGSVTTHSDVTSAGSGAIITGAERTKLAGIADGATANAGTVNEVEKDSVSQSVSRAKIDFRDTGDATVTVTDDPANDRTIVSIDATAGGGGGGTQKGTPFVVGDLLQVESAAGDGTIQTAGVQTSSFATAAQGALADTALQAVVADTAPVLGGDLELAGFGFYEDYTATAGNTFAVGEVGYMVAAGTITKMQANSEAAVSGLPVMAMEAITGGTSGKFCRLGDVKGLPGPLTVGAKYYVSASTAGAITATQPSGSSEHVRIMGYARTATTFVFQPSPDWIELVA